jgi:hypothetical protein
MNTLCSVTPLAVSHYAMIKDILPQPRLLGEAYQHHGYLLGDN